MLHTLPHCASSVDFPALLRLLKEGDALLLLQDGVPRVRDFALKKENELYF
ncbi:hypothetical protein ACLD4C_20690, partial [Salmonella sp. 741265071_PSA]